MEHNEPNDTFDPGQTGASGGARPANPGGFGGAADAAGAGGPASAGAAGAQGAMGDIGRSQQQGSQPNYQQNQQQMKERLGQAREKAVDIKHSVESTLAERLEQGAQRLRARRNAARSAVAGSGVVDDTLMRGGPGTPAYAGAEGAAASTAQRTDKLETSVARGMEKTADWLRDGDLRTTVEQEVKKNPARSVVVALGLGYLLGKMFKR